MSETNTIENGTDESKSKILKFLEQNQDIQLDDLKQVYKICLEFKQSNPNKKFANYFSELESSNRSYQKELLDISETNKKLDKRYYLLKQKLEDKLTTIDEAHIEDIFRTNKSAKEYLNRYLIAKENNKFKDELIRTLKEDLDAYKKDLIIWQDRCFKAEEQRDSYERQWRDAQVKQWELEAETLASHKRSINNFEQSMNRSYASSYMDQPHMPILDSKDIPTMEEVMKTK